MIDQVQADLLQVDRAAILGDLRRRIGSGASDKQARQYCGHKWLHRIPSPWELVSPEYRPALVVSFRMVVLLLVTVAERD
ncbi:MAG: hypothetical protein JO121_22350 [Deltaproteobacteria bacterium]|nr:hypothetical protein [Deltaproteobacteria bacterium]